jgi:tetratricopeptide (TPR) repeat protein
MNLSRTHYDVLQIAPDASAEVIQGAYRALLKNGRLHPDLGGSGEEAQAINGAYSVLSDPALRQAYDRELARRQPPPGTAEKLTRYVLICPACRKRNLVEEQEALGKLTCGHCRKVLLPPRAGILDADDRRAYRIGLYLYDKRMYDRCRREFEAAVRLQPGNAVYQYWLGRALYQQGQPEKARDAFQAAVTLNGGQFQSRFWLGQVLHRLRRFGEAVSAFEQALTLRPRHTGTLTRLAACHFRLGEHDAAIRHLETALAHEPRRDDLHILLGLVRLADGDSQAALDGFHTADRLKPGDPRTRKYIALAAQRGKPGFSGLRALWEAFKSGATGA